MKTNVRESSIDCYHGIDLNRGQAKVIAFLVEHPGEYTRNELAKLSGIPINAVCGRINELIESGAVEERVRACGSVYGQAITRLAIGPAASCVGARMMAYLNVRCPLCGFAMIHSYAQPETTTWPPTSLVCASRLCPNANQQFEPVTIELKAKR